MLCPSRAEGEQSTIEAQQREKRNRGHSGRLKRIQQNVVHSAARRRSMLCRSTTYRAHHHHQDERGTSTPGKALGLPVAGLSGTAQRRPQPTAARNLLRHRGKGNWRAHGDPGSGAGPLAQPRPVHRSSAHARERRGLPVWGGREDAVGNQNVRRASGGLRETCGSATPEGRWAGCGCATRGGHGHTERRSQNRCWKAGARDSCNWLISSESGGRNWCEFGAAPTKFDQARPAFNDRLLI